MKTSALDRVYQSGTFGQLIVESVQRYPERIAFIDGDRSISYAVLGQQIAKAIAHLDHLGLRAGDVVAQLGGNRIETFCIMAAAYVHGLCSVTLHPMASAQDHREVLADCRPKVFVCDAVYAARGALLQQQCDWVLHWCSHDELDGAMPSFWRAAEKHKASALVAQGDPEQIIRLAYTGGTTGRAKGVMLSSRAMLTNALLWLAGLTWPDGVRSLCSAPISHGAGSLIVPTLMRGGTVVLQRGFDKDQWLAAVEQHRIQFTFMVPTMLCALLEYPATKLANCASLQALIYGAAPMSSKRIQHALEMFGPVLVQSYGQTEAPNTILLLNQHDHARADQRLLASAGRPFPGLDVSLLDEAGSPVVPGEIGEICVRGPLVMSGYHDQEDQTRSALAHGWLHTGDLASRDEAGYFYIVDRKKDMIISGGFNVYAREVEDALMSHPAVEAAAVIGVPDPKWGEAVTAVVVLRVHLEVGVQELIGYVRDIKGPVCAPKRIEFVDALPLTSLGKPDKKALRTRTWGLNDGVGEPVAT
ncbi:TPA: AMP-binding protein [Pseudomonas aeruginosa]